VVSTLTGNALLLPESLVSRRQSLWLRETERECTDLELSLVGTAVLLA
jgi:hypothetical protein